MIAGNRQETDFCATLCAVGLEFSVVGRNLDHDLTDGAVKRVGLPVRRSEVLDDLSVVVQDATLHKGLHRQAFVVRHVADARTDGR